MALDTLISIALPFLVAVGSAFLVWIFMEARLDTALTKERAIARAAQIQAEQQAETWNERARALEETAKRRALDEILSEIHMEERRYLRRSRSGLGPAALVVQERLSFRGIPLSPWSERVLSAERGEEIVALMPGSDLNAAGAAPALTAARNDLAPRPGPVVVYPGGEERAVRPAAVNAPEPKANSAALRLHRDREPRVDPYRDAGIDIVSPFLFDATTPGPWADDGRPRLAAAYPTFDIHAVEEGPERYSAASQAQVGLGSNAAEVEPGADMDSLDRAAER